MDNSRDYVLAAKTPPSLFNFYPTRAAAEADQDRANGETTPEWCRAKYVPMTWEEYDNMRRAFYLHKPEQLVGRLYFRQMLECLPPLYWTSTETFESFLMSEFYSVPYTKQYVRRGSGMNARFYSKMVDATDRTTWMTAEEAR